MRASRVPLTVLCVTVVALTGMSIGGAADEGPTAQDVRAAVSRAVPLIERSTAEYPRQRKCFSCHHQTMGVLALGAARRAGIAIDEQNFQEQLRFTEASLKSARENYRQGRQQGGGATTAGYALWTLQLGGWKGDETTDAVASFLLRWQEGQGYWSATTRRPPTEGSPFATTFVSLRGMNAYGTSLPPEAARARKAAAAKWLETAEPQDTEDRVFRLLAVKEVGADAGTLQAAGKALLETQRAEGGWSQLADLEPDAYATGSALAALRETGQLRTTDAGYRAGLRFLLRTQLEDGSWRVRTRSRPFQTPFESGFPHGADQFISMAATGWAVTALAESLPPSQ